MGDATNSDHRQSSPDAEGQRPRRKIDLALQGGGSHGAFTWGVIDRLLDEADLEIEGVSGTSAGAMNAIILASGLARGGRRAAQQELRAFWQAVGRMPGISRLSIRPPGTWHLDSSPAYLWFDLMSRMLSPYQLNPANINPLRDLVTRQIDFDAIRSAGAIRVFVSATNVRTGRRRVFGNSELSAEAVIASACLPFLFQAVEIDGEAYWDGGYSGNPALMPLYHSTDTSDIIIIGINPFIRPEIPRRARDVINRVNEITFNASFFLEVEAVRLLIDRMIGDESAPRNYHRLFLHGISAEDKLRTLGASSKLNNDLEFLEYLYTIGRQAGGDWLDRFSDGLGSRTTLDYGPPFL
jgi:NTE family protein